MRTAFLALCFSALFSQYVVADPIGQTSVADGALRGVSNGPVSKFLGIPYAAPPLGDNRWRAPKPVAPWSGVLAADHFSHACYQKETARIKDVSEDCLYLNVWTPAQDKAAHLPVLFWIFGGGFEQGAASEPAYDGEALAKKGIIVVTFDFRMGALGFLAHPALTAESPAHASGNYGMLDTVAALKWVRANIAAFGGDPNAITIAGHSSAAGQVSYLDVSPLSRGLYARAIIESGARLGRAGTTLQQGEDQGVRYAKSLGADSLAALRALPPDKVLAATKDGFRFAQIYDGEVLPKTPIDMIREGQFNKTPVMTGVAAEEHTGNNPKADEMSAQECAGFLDEKAGAFAQKFKDAYLKSPGPNCYEGIRDLDRDRNLAIAYDWAKVRLALTPQPIYTYVFNHPQPGPNAAKRRSFHGDELVYWFDNLDKAPKVPFVQADRDIAAKMIDYWTNFVKTGNPNGPGLSHWASVDPKKPETMELGDRFAMRPVITDEKRTTLVQEYLDSEAAGTLFEGALPFSR